MAASDFLELELLDHSMGVASWTMPTVFIALCTADPTDSGTGADMSEVADAGAYARVACAAYFGTPAATGSISNDVALAFTAATAGWGTVTHFAILDSTTHGAGNMLHYGALTAEKTVTTDDIVRFPIGELTISCT